MQENHHNELIHAAENWFSSKNWTAFPFQKDTWAHFLQGYHGLLNAPTGSGKTYSLMIPAILEGMSNQSNEGIQLLWITPIRALAKEIYLSGQRAIKGLSSDWTIAIRTGDTSPTDRKKQKQHPPNILITTPESVHVLFTNKEYSKWFSSLKAIVIDEWHELIGSKRGVLMELALSRLKTICPGLKIWGISATIGNMQQAMEVLFGSLYTENRNSIQLVQADIEKVIEIETIYPKQIENFPWSGHLGTRMAKQILPMIYENSSTLIFTNTRGQCELWYQKLLEVDPDLSGIIAMHHGSISRELRNWVEDALHQQLIKAVVCTSSLDLGVDFRPVEAVIQIGSPKGIARFIQRAGRSGHEPGKTSKIYFVPTNSLEILEGAALKEALHRKIIEDRIPFIRSFDVLVQYVITLSLSEGFLPDQILDEVKSTYAFASITEEEWMEVLEFCRTGSRFSAYDEFKKIGIDPNGKYRIRNRSLAMRHLQSIGAIVSARDMKIKYRNGKHIGNVEEYFVTRMELGDTFWFAGKALEIIGWSSDAVIVKKSAHKEGRTPSWQGGRMPLSSQLSEMIRSKMSQIPGSTEQDIQKLKPLFDIQKARSIIPRQNEFLIEYFYSREGYHLIFYPFEGRNVHEGMGAVIGYRIAQMVPISFSFAMNDYGFELLSADEIPIEEALEQNLFRTQGLHEDIMSSVNAIEMARKKFWEIASISGMIFKGYRGNQKKERHLQASSSLIFDVFQDYDPNHLLYMQAFEEVLSVQLEEQRLYDALARIQKQNIIVTRPDKPTPFSFPIIVDGMREKLTSEKLSDRIAKMQVLSE